MGRDNTPERAAEILSAASKGVVFTGAGISAESGIPTYRGHGGSVWSRYDPDRYANIENFFSEPEYFWSFFKEVRSKVLSQCRPNAGHQAITELQKKGIIHWVITQNIDGLHQLAGAENVLELHGNTRFFDCLECDAEYALEDIQAFQEKSLVPRCVGCQGVIKPRVVYFGEALNMKTLQNAMQAATSCDLMLVVGSTLQVYPAAQLPVIAAERNKPVIIVNYGPTQLDRLATCRLEGKAAEILPALADFIKDR